MPLFALVALVLTAALSYVIDRRLKAERTARDYVSIEITVDLSRYTEAMAELRRAFATCAAATKPTTVALARLGRTIERAQR